MQSCEQGMDVLVWQYKIIVLFKLVPPCLMLLARNERWNGHAPLILRARKASPTSFYLGLLNPTFQSTMFCFALMTEYAAGDLK